MLCPHDFFTWLVITPSFLTRQCPPRLLPSGVSEPAEERGERCHFRVEHTEGKATVTPPFGPVPFLCLGESKAITSRYGICVTGPVDNEITLILRMLMLLDFRRVVCRYFLGFSRVAAGRIRAAVWEEKEARGRVPIGGYTENTR